MFINSIVALLKRGMKSFGYAQNLNRKSIESEGQNMEIIALSRAARIANHLFMNSDSLYEEDDKSKEKATMEDELISRRRLKNMLNAVAMEHHETHIPLVEHDFRELIDKTEVVDSVKHGRWKDSLYEKKCSECNFGISKQLVSQYYYCPRCGAKMDGE